jgi:hypothetical protein
MATKLFTGGRVVILGTGEVFLTAGLAHAAPPQIRPPLPPPGGPHIGRLLLHPGVHPIGRPVLHPGQPVQHPYYGGYFFSGYSYAPYNGGNGDYYPDYRYSYRRSFADYGTPLTLPANPAQTAKEKDVATLLAASGVPTDEGRPVWPLALRVLPGKEPGALRGQIDALLQEAAMQAGRSRPNTAVFDELVRATEDLRKLLLRHRQERGGLAQASYEQADRFLDKLAGAQKLLRVQLAPAP